MVGARLRPRRRLPARATFFLLGLVGGIAGWLAAQDHLLLAAVLVGGSALLAVVLPDVVASMQTGDRDGTTEAAALLVLATGSLAGMGYGGPSRSPSSMKLALSRSLWHGLGCWLARRAAIWRASSCARVKASGSVPPRSRAVSR